MDPLNPPRLPDVDNPELYIENRTQLLRQAYDNYAVWEAQLALAKLRPWAVLRTAAQPLFQNSLVSPGIGTIILERVWRRSLLDIAH